MRGGEVARDEQRTEQAHWDSGKMTRDETPASWNMTVDFVN